MKRLIYAAIPLLVLLECCKAWDPTMIGVKKEPISPKLLTLERKFEDMANTTVVTNDDEVKLFTKEVEENLIDPYGDKYGYIVFKRNLVDVKTNIGLSVINGMLACIPALLGVPFTVYKYKIEIELRVLNRDNKLLGKYSAVGNSK